MSKTTLAQAIESILSDLESKNKSDDRQKLIGSKVIGIGDKNTGQIGTLRRSTHGLSVSGVAESGGRWQTLGESVDTVLKEWRVVDDEAKL